MNRSAYRIERLGWHGMVVLLLFAIVWCCMRIVGARQLTTGGVDLPVPRNHPDRRRGPQDAIAPQDAQCPPQDEVTTVVDERTRECTASSGPQPDLSFDLPFAVVTVLWRDASAAVCGLVAGCRAPSAVASEQPAQVSSSESGDDRVAAFHELVVRTVHRPHEGPACFGGRDDAVYLRGWDDAVDWVGGGHDAQAPTWGDVAYMTGWNDAIRDVARARRGACRAA